MDVRHLRVLRELAEREEVVLRPLQQVPAVRWIVGMSRPDRARRVVVRRVVTALREVAPRA